MVALCLLVTFAGPASAQSLGEPFAGAGLTQTSLQLIAVISVLALAPGILVMITSFPFIVTVLAILRQAIGLQQSPPNMLIVSLALFLTWHVMDPVFARAWTDGIKPVFDGEMELTDGVARASVPFRQFMLDRVDDDALQTMMTATDRVVPDAGTGTIPFSVLIPTFMLSEISRAFQVGFLIFLPFLIIDLVVAAVLMSMGMMMVPPAIVSLPFKLSFLVVSGGWSLISASLVRSYY